jgi:hypothetical protein
LLPLWVEVDEANNRLFGTALRGLSDRASPCQVRFSELWRSAAVVGRKLRLSTRPRALGQEAFAYVLGVQPHLHGRHWAAEPSVLEVALEPCFHYPPPRRASKSMRSKLHRGSAASSRTRDARQAHRAYSLASNASTSRRTRSSTPGNAEGPAHLGDWAVSAVVQMVDLHGVEAAHWTSVHHRDRLEQGQRVFVRGKARAQGGVVETEGAALDDRRRRTLRAARQRRVPAAHHARVAEGRAGERERRPVRVGAGNDVVPVQHVLA